MVAIDARSGAELWRTLLTDEQNCFGATGAPFVVRNRVLLGTRGGDTWHLRGALHAFDAETGDRVWRFFTVPAPASPDRRLGPQHRRLESGGGAPWTTGTYDPELNLIYWTTGNPGPKDFDGRGREGDNLYTASLLAMNPDNGKLAWHFQFTPHDEHDWDGNQTPVLVDADWNGEPRKLLLQASRNGFFYVLDRTNGKMLLAEPFRQADLGETNRARRPAGARGRLTSELSGNPSLPRHPRRDELAGPLLQPFDGTLLRVGARRLRDVLSHRPQH